MNQHRNGVLEQLTRRYYFQISHYFCCRLDSEAEAEQLTLDTLRIATVTAIQRGLPRDDEWLLSVAGDLLRQRWMENRCQEVTERPEYVSVGYADDLQDQAAALYIKLRALQGNPAATAEASAAIRHWMGNDLQRQEAYERVRKVLYRQGERRPPAMDAHHLAWAAGSRITPNRDDFDSHSSLGWTDIVLLVFAFLLLLPMIYFLAVPVGH